MYPIPVLDAVYLLLLLALSFSVLRGRGKMVPLHFALIVGGILCFAWGALLGLTEDIAAWRAVPVLGSDDPRHGLFQLALGYLPGVLLAGGALFAHIRVSRVRELEGAVARLTAVHGLRDRLLGQSTLDDLLREVAAGLRELTDAERVTVFVLDREAAPTSAAWTATAVGDPEMIPGEARLMGGPTADAPLPSRAREGAGRSVFPVRVDDEEGALIYLERGPTSPALSTEQVLGVELAAKEIAAALDRGRSEAALRKQRRLWQAAVSRSPVGMMLMDASGRFLEYNRSVEEITGYRREDVADDESWCRAVSGDRDGFAVLWAGWRQVAYGNVDRPFDVGLRRADGETRQVSIRAQTIFSREGEGAHYAITVEDVTERDRALRALAESQHLYSAVVNQIPSGVVAVLPDTGEIVFANDTAAAMSGYSSEELVGLSVLQLVAVEEHAAILPRLAERARGRDDGAPWVYTVVRRDGTRFRAEFAGTVASWKGRKAFVTVVNDITERLAAEEERRRQFGELSAIFNSLDGAVYVADLETYEILYANEHLLRRLGDEVVGRRCYEVLHAGQDRPCSFCTNSRLVVHGEVQPPVVWEQEEAGTGAWYQCVDQAIQWTDGRLVRMEIALDVTQQKQTEAALSFQREVTETALRHAPVGVTLVAADQTVLLWNDYQARLHGVPAGQVEGRKLQEAFRDGVLSHVAGLVEGVLATGRPFANPDLELEGADGTSQTLDLAIYPLLGDAGEVVGAAALGTDVTENRLTEERLRQSAKLNALGQLAGGVAHDFKNLLAVILGNVSLARVAAPAETGPLLRDAEQAAHRAEGVVRQLLTFARRAPARKAVTDLSEVAAEAVALMRHAVERQVEIGLELGPEPALVWGDADQLHQIVVNLFLNARDAITEKRSADGDEGRGPYGITVRTRRAAPTADAKQGAVVLVVQDNGCGMDEPTRQRVFEPFFTTKGEGKGTGLGMATVYGIVREHGGWIDIATRPGEGASITVYLPESTEAPEAASAASSGLTAGVEEAVAALIGPH